MVILALEDVAEAPYRIDRMLTQWRMSGAFQGVVGIVLGRFSRCEPPKDVPSWTVEEVLRDRLSDLGIPIVSDLPFGHEGVNAALPVGQPVDLLAGVVRGVRERGAVHGGEDGHRDVPGLRQPGVGLRGGGVGGGVPGVGVLFGADRVLRGRGGAGGAITSASRPHPLTPIPFGEA